MQNCYEVCSVQGHMLHKGRGSEGLTPGSDPGSLGGVRDRASAQGSGAGKEGRGWVRWLQRRFEHGLLTC